MPGPSLLRRVQRIFVDKIMATPLVDEEMDRGRNECVFRKKNVILYFFNIFFSKFS
jgi:hypothetical protein